MHTNHNIFMPLGSNDDANANWSGRGLVAFKLVLLAAMLRGASVHTIMALALAGGLIALVVSIILKATAGPSTLAGDGYHVERDQSGQTWVQFDDKPPKAVRDALKQQLGARHDRRQAWRIRRRVSLQAVARVIERANRAQVPCARTQAPSGREQAPLPAPVPGPSNTVLASPPSFFAPSPAVDVSDGEEERQAQEALAHLERLEQQRREIWANEK